MRREPLATAQTRHVRVSANILTKDAFSPLPSDCVNHGMYKNPVLAQSTPVIAYIHGATGEL